MIVCATDYVGYKVVEFLIECGEQIVFLILDKNDKGGFNEKIISVYRKKYKDREIYFQNNLDDESFLNLIEESQSNIGILAWWPYILKGRVIKIPKKGWLNFHPAYLPFNRGKHPNFWCLVDETKCGVTLHFIDEGVDTGKIVVRKEIELDWEDTGKTIYEKSLQTIIDLFKNNFQLIKEGKLDEVEQEINEGTFHLSKEIIEATKIDLDKKYSARKIFNIIRGKMFAPYPTAYFYDNGKKYSVEIKIRKIES